MALSQNPLYTLTFLYLEPFFATLGALSILFYPLTYLELGQPNTAPHYHPALQPLFTTLAGGWLLLAFHDLVTLRMFRPGSDASLETCEKVWRCVLAAGLLSDVFYVTCLVQDLGLMWIVRIDEWRGIDWFTMSSTVWPMGLKVAAVGAWMWELIGNAGSDGLKTQ